MKSGTQFVCLHQQPGARRASSAPHFVFVGMNPNLGDIPMSVSSRTPGAPQENMEEINCRLNPLPSSEGVGRPLAILPLNTLHHGISLLPHLSLPHREVGTTAPLVNNHQASNEPSGSSTAVQAASTSTINSLPHGVADASAVDLASLFECPVCMDYALPPILQCQSGHIVCASCRSKLSSCPTCRGNLGK
ncbi:E3 ubiquitin-protein ligase [Fasciola hepatica]|uniref:E3 ubiquitin-protein ligase n=1 Tax=Fasciola hepatica TaxID=6192 RepID=A0A4E0RS92_FASHE|nr:E3 ubiquitin-protein ligase [Fasciola hepatica]